MGYARPLFLQHTYRSSILWLNADQKLGVERILSLSRLLRNGISTRWWREIYQTAEEAYMRAEALKQDVMTETLDFLLPDEAIWLESEIHALIVDRLDAIHHNHHKDRYFVNRQSPQTAWLLQPAACEIKYDRMRLPGMSIPVKLQPARIAYPSQPVAAQLKRLGQQYQLNLLYEKPSETRHPYQDTFTTQLGQSIIQYQYQDSELSSSGFQPVWSLRKQILDRLMRQLYRKRQQNAVSSSLEALSA